MHRGFRAVVVTCLLAAFGSLVSGCATFTQSPHEHSAQWSRISRADNLGLVEDIDLLLMTDRNSRLTKWHDR
ncbi:MAG: hypothetical protein IID36_04655 [Planctomycetes bacterium]|nr:hypothetical protein [Planctomycetota bacterium]